MIVISGRMIAVLKFDLKNCWKCGCLSILTASLEVFMRKYLVLQTLRETRLIIPCLVPRRLY